VAEPETELSLLREIQDSAVRHQKYIEERDLKQNEYLAAEAVRIQRLTTQQRTGTVLWVLTVLALYLIAMIQLLR